MIRSMTGYGRSQNVVEGYDITVEIKSVNHRYFEFSSRIPRAYGYLEERLKNYVHEVVARGKIDAYVSITALEVTDVNVQINKAFAASYLNELRSLGKDMGLDDNITLRDIAHFSDIYTISRNSQEEDYIWNLVKKVSKEALDKFSDMRQLEGGQLKLDLLARLDMLEQYTTEIEKNAPEIVNKYRERLYTKISELLVDRQIDEGRLLTEVAIFSERVATDEETVRLRSHLEQFRSILEEADSVGRKLDFLVQEINRETNTIGSKSQDVQAAKTVVEIKSEIEKIREQIQNIE